MKDLGTGQVWLIGTGPGDPDLLTLRAHRLIGQADVVVHDRLVSPEIMALVPAGTRRIDVGKSPGNHAIPQDRINALLVALAYQGLSVARLKGGDPMIFGRGAEEAAALTAEGIPVAIVPGITAAQGAAATLGLPLTQRGSATGLRYVTGHRAADAALDLDWTGLSDRETTIALYMGVATLCETTREMIGHGLDRHTPVVAVASATTPRQRHIISSLDRIAADMETAALEGPVLFLIGRGMTPPPVFQSLLFATDSVDA